MNKWHTLFTAEAEADFERLDRQTQVRIGEKIQWLESHCAYMKHNSLHARWRGLYKLRIGNWRVIYEIENSNHCIIVHRIRKRDEVYEI